MSTKKTKTLHYGFVDDEHTYTCMLMLERMTRHVWAYTISYYSIATLQCPTLKLVLHYKNHPWVREPCAYNDLYVHIAKVLQAANIPFRVPKIISADKASLCMAIAEGLADCNMNAFTDVDYYDEKRHIAEWMHEDADAMPYKTWTLADLTS